MNGQDKVLEPPRHPARRLAGPGQQLPAGGPRHMKTTPGPEQWAIHRLVSVAARLHERRLNQRLAKYKLTTSALDAMEAVAELQPATAANVAAMLCVSRQSMGKVLRRLQALGYLGKAPGRDGRSADLHLTPEGQAVLSAAEKLIQAETGNELEGEYEFRHQLEQHIRQLRTAERGTGTWRGTNERRVGTVSASRHGQEQRTTPPQETGAITWQPQTGPPAPKPPFKKQPRQ